uniref:Dihydroorotase n=1 Tax=Ignisphaera aggregans TaxID=334771 RepID=A0A7C2V9S8_9CREN
MSISEVMLFVRNGIVAKRYSYVDKSLCRNYECIDLRDMGILLPGFIDMHVHLRGLDLSYKEDEESGTKAALHGGFTAVIDMPNTTPKIDNLEALQMKLSALKLKSYTDYGLYVSPTNREEIMRKMLLAEGVVGVKLFPQDIELIPMVTRTIKKLGTDKILMVHAENHMLTSECSAGMRWVCRPIESEVSALNTLKKFNNGGARIHVTHVTNILTLALAKSYGFTADTCPHYLYLTSEHEKSLGCIAKVNPPLRTDSTRLLMLKNVRMFDALTSDHAPHSMDEKSRDFHECPPGISSIDVMASLVLNLVARGFIDLGDVARLLSRGPAGILGIGKWGCMTEGCIASYTVVDLEQEVCIDPQNFFSKAKHSPYKSMRLKGAVRATVVRGYVAYLDKEIVEKPEPLPITRFRGG